VRRIRRDLTVLVASLVVFAGCAVVAADGRVRPAERAVFRAINGLPGWLYRPMLLAQYLGMPRRWCRPPVSPAGWCPTEEE
jgi:tellurite resistance protein